MADAIVLRETGGPEVLKVEPVDVGPPGPGEVRLRQTAVGVNFHDCYVRSGLYKTLKLPGIPGLEAAGIVDAIGPDVTGFRAGDRVAYFTAAYGGYASERIARAADLVRLPETIDDRTAASVMVKGLTAHMLLHRVHPIVEGNRILVHAAVGGVGILLCQWASRLGAEVIGTVGSREKAAIARRNGCHHVILYREEDFVARVREITGGRGVDVAYDSVGKDTFLGSLDCLGRLGHLVNFGQSSGPVAPFEVSRLSARSTSVTRPMLFHHTTETATRDRMAGTLFSALADGTIRAGTPETLPLAEAAAAHRRLEQRRTSGALVLVP
ncbi:MAG: quinone oxidoreductase [Hyphomicrobiaceae bacterium]|nr:quinone oxidoreductase [Hyphomicrobiaceae bacterium]